MSYKKLVHSCVFIISCLGAIYVNALSNTKVKQRTVGIIVPIEHQALTDIVNGFKQTLKQYDDSINIIVKNALGEINIQRSIIEQFKHQNIDLMVPVSLGTTQMAANLNSRIPIISLASKYDQNQQIPKNVAGVSDEIGAKKKIELLKAIYPQIKKFSLIYSGSEKILPEVEDAVVEANDRGIKVQKMMIKELRDLYSVSRMISDDSELIFILKDNLVASGVQTLVREAKKRKIPLMTSDECTIIGGGSFALGVKEQQIGIQGAKLAIKLFAGANIQELPFEQMEELTIFYNEVTCRKQELDVSRLKTIANNMQYSILSVTQSYQRG